ncbi:hypothetical protein H5410_062158 [Solanum commersonii]|uniref:Uncharacterized protein n=1 Tax=Solanum commersonii TaxID=4109 RepID=A0A9J5WBE9_SOLCO|nr:hypothetical protein H5410_062158 [Solanum commersonii]
MAYIFWKGIVVFTSVSYWKTNSPDNANINKTRPSCERVKVQVNLLGELPKFVELEVVDPVKNSSNVEKIKVVYDMLPKYCRKCKLQGHNEDDYRFLHLELRRKEQPEEEKVNDKEVVQQYQRFSRRNYKHWVLLIGYSLGITISLKISDIKGLKIEKEKVRTTFNKSDDNHGQGTKKKPTKDMKGREEHRTQSQTHYIGDLSMDTGCSISVDLEDPNLVGKDGHENLNKLVIVHSNKQSITNEVNIRHNDEDQAIVNWSKGETIDTNQGDEFLSPL